MIVAPGQRVFSLFLCENDQRRTFDRCISPDGRYCESETFEIFNESFQSHSWLLVHYFIRNIRTICVYTLSVQLPFPLHRIILQISNFHNCVIYVIIWI